MPIKVTQSKKRFYNQVELTAGNGHKGLLLGNYTSYLTTVAKTNKVGAGSSNS